MRKEKKREKAESESRTLLQSRTGGKKLFSNAVRRETTGVLLRSKDVITVALLCLYSFEAEETEERKMRDNHKLREEKSKRNRAGIGVVLVSPVSPPASSSSSLRQSDITKSLLAPTAPCYHRLLLLFIVSFFSFFLDSDLLPACPRA